MSGEREGALIGFGRRFFPLRPPIRRAFGHRPGLNGPSIGLAGAHITAADETEPAVIEIITIVVVDHHAVGAGRDERIKDLVLQDYANTRSGLIGVVAAN